MCTPSLPRIVKANVPLNGDLIPVIVNDVHPINGRKMAHITADHGEPFSSWTHGGYAYSASANVIADTLQDVQIADCPHLHTFTETTGRLHYSGGEVWDDLHDQTICLDCGQVLSAHPVIDELPM